MGIKIRKIAVRHGKLFFINDRPDLALAVGADGVHLGQDDLPVAVVRKLARGAGKKLSIGKSTHSLEQALAAEAERTDYIGVGPIFRTPTKAGYHPVGLDLITQVRRQVRLPFVAIGGIHLANINQVLNAGATRVAVVRAVFSAEDPKNAAKLLCRAIKTYRK
jgi:thiamine-phosphate pyrophosphorylase